MQWLAADRQQADVHVIVTFIVDRQGTLRVAYPAANTSRAPAASRCSRPAK